MNIKTISALLAAIVGITTLAGCTPIHQPAPPKVERIDYNKRSLSLSIGMTKAQVMDVMGAPRRTDVNTDRERWVYWNKVIYGYAIVDDERLANDRLTVTFVDSKVTKWGAQTTTEDIIEVQRKSAEAMAKAYKP
ncbi:TPA: outer membrane protein assembly factor BamE [Enterobacter cloacae]